MIARHFILWLLCLAAAIVSLAWQLVAIVGSPRRAMRIAIGFDQTANAAFGGDEDETISSRAWRYRAEPHYAALARLINVLFNNSNHCAAAYESEQARRQA